MAFEKKYKTEEERLAALKASKQRANVKYLKSHYTRYNVAFHNENDANVIAWLNAQENKMDAIRKLVLKEIEKDGK